MPKLTDKFQQQIFEDEINFWGLNLQKYHDQLSRIFNFSPKRKEPSFQKWEQIERFDFKKFISDENFELVAKKNFNENLDYYGQITRSNDTLTPHGVGREIWQNGDMYEGQFENGVKSGFGRYIWADGKFYVGQWSND